MGVLRTTVDRSSADFAANRAVMIERLSELRGWLDRSLAPSGPEYVERHRRRGRLLPRERIELLVDRDAPLLELTPLAAWGTEFALGATVITAVGVVSGVECVMVASDPTVRGGTGNHYTLRKILRALEIAAQNRLPIITLIESGGADLRTQVEGFVPGGAQFRELARLSAAGIPTLSLVFGNATAGGAYMPAMSDYVVMVRHQAKVFLGGPPLVKMATGEIATDEELGGADMHGRQSGVADYVAVDERDCLRLGREIMARLAWTKLGPGPACPSCPPRHDPDDLLGLIPSDPRLPFDVREVIGRIVDDSDFDEFKPLYGGNLVTGWASLHGFPLGIVANNGVLFSDESQKAAQLIQLANRRDTPLLFLHNTPGYMVGKRYEQAGIIKDGAKMVNAVATSGVPHLSLIVGTSAGAANYGMSGRSFEPRFLFTWPNSRILIMGPQQLSGVLSTVKREAAAARGRDFDEEADRIDRRAVEEQIEREGSPLFMTGRVYDDGVIDPRDTRTVLGVALSACHSNEVAGSDAFGVFRM